MAETLMALLMGVLTIAFGVFCGVMAINMLYQRVMSWRLARRSQTWPNAAGRVVAATSERIGRMRWAPKITYEYAVNGSTFSGSRLAFGHDKSYAAGEANALVAGYRVGQRVEVFYDPDRPAESTLKQTSLDASGELIVLSLVLLVPTVFCTSVGVIGLIQSWGK